MYYAYSNMSRPTIDHVVEMTVSRQTKSEWSPHKLEKNTEDARAGEISQTVRSRDTFADRYLYRQIKLGVHVLDQADLAL